MPKFYVGFCEDSRKLFKGFTYQKIIFLLLISCNFNMNPLNKAVRGCRSCGFGAEFLWVINHLRWCIKTNKIPVIEWGPASAYYSPDGYNGSKNAWEYFFEPVSNEKYVPGDIIHLELFYPDPENFSAEYAYHRYVKKRNLLTEDERKSFIDVDNHLLLYNRPIYYSEYPECEYHLYSERFREYVKTEIIDPFIKVKTSIQKKIDQFYNTYIAGKKTIAIHLRGCHIENGKMLPEPICVPVERVLQEANKYSDLGYQFFISTDIKPLLDKAIKTLKGKVIFYPSTRFDETTNPWIPGQLVPKLGEECLIEMMLMSRCDHIIHTISNFSTVVLLFNPKIKHTVLI